ncbi:MAG TPA: 4-hydroxy-3-methylbut-2-enyl diphosphate reductase [Actinomycetaceae bacterium]|nr:4-hydroxy-3-methylbut-2-enyl diphosphate reductase [Actinomycetaceae bacterium]
MTRTGTPPTSLAGSSAFPDAVPSVDPAVVAEPGKRILLAAPRGYCAGVDRAVDAVEKALEHYGPPIYVRKEIVHNKFVVETLSQRGAIFVQETDEVPEGARVVFSAHGVSPAVHAEAAARNLATIDATCPLVTKVHKEAVRFASSDYDILLIGHTGHEEVEGTQGEAPDHIQVVNGPHEVDEVEVRDPEKVVWLSQTTLSVDETMETVRLLRERFPGLQDPPSDDICYATQNRQVAVKELAPQSDVVIVVGSANSSNSVRLVEVALEAGAGAAHRVDRASEVDPAWLDGAMTVGVTSGASVPEILVRDVVARLGEFGFGEIEEVRTATEDIMFSLPKNLRADLKAAGAQPDRPHRVRANRL